jgi:hypothetical protein
MQIFKDTTQCFLLVVLIQQKENTFDLGISFHPPLQV